MRCLHAAQMEGLILRNLKKSFYPRVAFEICGIETGGIITIPIVIKITTVGHFCDSSSH